MPLILEGLVTTQDAQGAINLAPMGPIVDRALTHLTLRPFQTSQTFQNLSVSPFGVLHVTDDVGLIAKAAIGKLDTLPPMQNSPHVPVRQLADACRWIEFRVRSIDDRDQRAQIACEVLSVTEGRPFFGLNRAKHAVLEAAILATRIGLLPAEEILQALARLEILVHKTAGDQEEQAFALLQATIHEQLRFSSTP